MRWISKFFNQKSQPCQQASNPPVEQNSNTTQNPHTMLQVVVEETVMTAAKWLVTLINRSLEAKAVAPVAEPQTAVANAGQSNPDNISHTTAAPATSNHSDDYQTSTIEELLTKFSCLIEQSHDRIQSTTTLENRIHAIEIFLRRNSKLEQQVKELSQSFVSLENRLAEVENLVERVDITAIEESLKLDQQLEQRIETGTQLIANVEDRLLMIESSLESENSAFEQIVKVDQNVTGLEKRIGSLENLITQLSSIRRYVENNYRSIESLQNHVKNLDSASISDKNGSHN